MVDGSGGGDGRYAVVCGLVNVVIYYAVGKLNVTLKQATTTRLDHSRRVSHRRNRRVYKFAAVRAAFRSIVIGGIGSLGNFGPFSFFVGAVILGAGADSYLLPYFLDTALLPYCLTALLPYSKRAREQESKRTREQDLQLHYSNHYLTLGSTLTPIHTLHCMFNNCTTND